MRIEFSVMKTIAGFLNAGGGNLLIGVNDDGDVHGIEADGFPDQDKMALHFANLIDAKFGNYFRPYIHFRFEEQDKGCILLVRCESSVPISGAKPGGWRVARPLPCAPCTGAVNVVTFEISR